MTIYSVISLLASSLCLVVGLLAFSTRSSRSHDALSGITFLIAVWTLFPFLTSIASQPTTQLIIARLIYLAAAPVPVAFLYLTLSLIDSPASKFEKAFIRMNLAMTLIFMALTFHPAYITGVGHVNGARFVIPGRLFPIFIGYFVFVCGWTFWRLIREYPATSGLKQNQLRYFFIGFIFAYIGGAVHFLSAYINKEPFPHDVLVATFILTIAYAILRYRLMDIALLMRDTTVHILTSFLIGGTVAILTYPLIKNFAVVVFLLSFTILVPVIYKGLYSWVRENINRTRLGNIDQYLGQLSTQLDKLRETTFTYDSLAKNVVSGVASTFPIAMAAVYIFDAEKKALHLRAQIGMENPLVGDLRFNRSSLAIPESDALISYLARNKQVVIKEEIQMSPKRSAHDDEVIHSMERVEAEACIAFLLYGEPKGLLALGKKIGNRMFHAEDKEALNGIGRLVEDQLKYLMGMERELCQTALYSHDMNNDSKSLAQMLDYLLNDAFGKKSSLDDKKEILSQALNIARKLDLTFYMNMDRSDLILKALKGEYEKIPVDIVDLMRKSCNEFVLKMSEKQIDFVRIFPDQTILVEGNPYDLGRVMSNLLANALRYVEPNGRITVEFNQTKEAAVFTVKDNGNGIAPADLDKIWNRGWQVQDAKQGAAGLGLVIARQIIELHNGRIWAESEGFGKGAKFIFTVPIYDENKSSRLHTV